MYNSRLYVMWNFNDYYEFKLEKNVRHCRAFEFEIKCLQKKAKKIQCLLKKLSGIVRHCRTFEFEIKCLQKKAKKIQCLRKNCQAFEFEIQCRRKKEKKIQCLRKKLSGIGVRTRFLGFFWAGFLSYVLFLFFFDHHFFLKQIYNKYKLYIINYILVVYHNLDFYIYKALFLL